MQLVPLADRIVVKATEQDGVTATGLIIPDTAKEKPQEGEVMAVGLGRMTDQGVRVPMNVVQGDRVLFARYAGTDVKHDGAEYLILRESDVLAKMA